MPLPLRRDLVAAPIALLLLGCAYVGHAAPAPIAPTPVPLPTVRHGHRLERVAGGLVAFGGFSMASDSSDRGTQQTWWLGPRDDRWQRRADMNTGRAFFASVTVGDVVYAIGDGIERYDFAADRWQQIVAPGALPVSHFAAAAVGHTAYVLGGFPLERTGFFAVDLDTGTVRQQTPPPGFRPGDHFHFACALGGRLHVIGGVGGDAFQLRSQHWVLGDGGWQAQPDAPAGMWAKFAAQAVVGDRVWLFGDFGAFRFDAGTGAWTRCAGLPYELVMPATVVLGGSLWIVGGMRVDGDRKNLLLEYDLARDRFVDRTP